QPSNVTAQPQPSNVTAQPQPSNVTAQPQPSNVTAQPQPSNVTAQPQPSNVTAQPQPSNVTAQPQPSNVTAQPQPSNVTAQPQPSNVTNSLIIIQLIEHVSIYDEYIFDYDLIHNQNSILLSENLFIYEDVVNHESIQQHFIFNQLGINDRLLLKINNQTWDNFSEYLSINDSLNLYLNDQLIEQKIQHHNQTLDEQLGITLYLPIDPPKIILPNVTESWINGNQTNNLELIGDAKILNDTELDLTSISLDGTDDFAETIPTNATTYITNMTISAWIKPDYTKGSDEFTIVSKARSFVLSINNVLTPQKIAKFSVFDGIKWTSVESKSQIVNGWTHLAASFNKTAIMIYVNGTLEGTIPITGIPYITSDGQISIKTVDEITSANDVVIGAAVTPDMKHSAENLYSGLITDVEFYDTQLSGHDIESIFIANTPVARIFTFEPENSTEIPESVLPTSITNSTDMQEEGVILSTNGTQSEIIAVNEENLNNDLSSLTVSSWVKPNYTNGSSEFTIVGKENSFVLSINKLIPPEKVAKFSVFDGISWTTITGTKAIQNWSHVAGIINKTKISLYVNGTLEGTAFLPEPISFSQGKLNVTHANVATSESNVVIGALINTQRDEPRFSNYFSGIIGDASVYKKALTQEQIQTEFNAYISTLKSSKISGSTISLSENILIKIEKISLPFEKGLPEIQNDSNKIKLNEDLKFDDSILLNHNGQIHIQIFEQLGIHSSIARDESHLQFVNLNENMLINNEIFAVDPRNPYYSTHLGLDDKISLFLNGIPILEPKNNPSLLEHNEIEIGKIVNWTQTVIVNETRSLDSILVEIPADAQDIAVEILHENDTVSEISQDMITILNDDDVNDNSTDVELPEKLEKFLEKQQKKLDKLAKKINVTSIASLDLATMKELKQVKQHEKPSKFIIINETKLDVNEKKSEKIKNSTKSDKEYLIKFATPAPYTKENDFSTDVKFQRNVTVAHNSTLHYTNVKTYTDLPEYLVEHNVDFKLHWMINGSKVDVTLDPRFNVTFVDTDGNGISDRMKWTVPQLSEQEFEVEADINIINVQSYPKVGSDWTVRFDTIGIANLTITAINGTTFGDAYPADLKFLELTNGTHSLNYTINGNSVFYPNYTSNSTGSETSTVMTTGIHILEFRFGNDVQYAFNSAVNKNGPSVILLRGAAGDIDNTADQDITWSIEDREDAAFDHSTVTNTERITVLEDGVYRINYGLYVTTTNDGTGNDARYQILSHLLVNGADSKACYGSGYNRGGGSSALDSVAKGSCLIELDADSYVSLVARRVSNSATTGAALTGAQSWIHLQKIDNPNVIILREDSNGAAFSSGNQTVSWTVQNRTDSSFTHSLGTPSVVTVQNAGYYKVTYGVGVTQTTNNRASTFGQIQTNSSGVWASIPYGWSHINQRGNTDTRDAAVGASTILYLDSQDALRVNIGVGNTGAVNRNSVADRMHLDLEYLGTTAPGKILQIRDVNGGDDLGAGTFTQKWDTIDTLGSDYSFTADGTDVTIHKAGLYNIAYGIYTSGHTGSTRFEWTTSLYVNGTQQNVCYGGGYNRGDQGTYDSMEGGAESSCFIELPANVNLSIRNIETSTASSDSVSTTANRIWWVIHSMDPTYLSLSENLGISEPELPNKPSHLHLNENLGLQDELFTLSGKFASFTENIGFNSPELRTDYSKIILSEQVGIKDRVTQFGSEDFRIQRDCTIMSSGSTTSTLTAGSEYDAPFGEAFVRIVNTRLTANGVTSGGGNQNLNDFSAYISDASDMTNQIVFTRNSNPASDDRICWEIVEYIGPSDGPNAIDVLDIDTVTYASSSTTASGASVTPADDNDVVVFITGQAGFNAGINDWNEALSTAEWDAANNEPDFTRGDASGTEDANQLSYAVVEFTGKHWKIQRVEHSYIDGNAGNLETDDIEAVNSLSRAFLHVQHRAGGAMDDLQELGAEVYLNSTADGVGGDPGISFMLDVNAADDGGETESEIVSVAWVIENTQVGNGLNVQHVGNTRGTGGGEEETWTETITAVNSLSQTSIMGETSTSTGTGTAYPRGAIALQLTADNTVTLYRSDTGQSQSYRFDVVEWPKRPKERTITDSLSTSDSISKVTSFARTITDDVVTLTDLTPDSVTSFTRTITDSLSTSDSISKVTSFARTITDDVVTLTDLTPISATSFTRTITDSLSTSDSVIGVVQFTRTITDSLSTDDSITKVTSFGRTITDSLSADDSIAISTSFTRTITDSLSTSDSVIGIVQFTRTMTDSLAAADTITTATSFGRLFSDSLSTDDSIAVSASFTRSITDSASFDDTITTATSFTRTMTDSLSAADSIARVITFGRTITDSLSTDDSITKVTSFARLFSDSLSTDDTITTAVSFTRYMTDSLTADDVIAVSNSFTRTMTDSLSTDDTITTATSFARLFSDSLSTDDSIAVSASFTRTITDSLSTDDSIAVSASFTRTMTDSLSASDSISRVITFGRTITDSLSTDDTITTATSFARLFSDSLSTADTVTTSTAFNRFMTDSLAAADTLLASVQFTRTMTDSLSTDDTITTATSFARLFSDSLSTDDTITTATSFARLFSDSLSTDDAVTTSTSFNRFMTDSLAAADTLLASVQFNRAITDSLSTDDSITKVTSFARLFTDAVSVNDILVPSTSFNRFMT
ncbi:MAG: hypothetical protein DWQ19_05535, partial [Crenarchaeota archaeon]